MSNLKSQIESLLFISAKPMSIKELTGLTTASAMDVEKACEEIEGEYKNRNGGVLIIKKDKSFQMVSSPENAQLAQGLVKNELAGELTRPSLETLTIIAYRGPISKFDLERIRGVNCSLILRNLLIRGLIELKADKVKKETYYNITFDFIRFLGITDINQLPDYDKLHQDDTLEKMVGM